MDDAPEPRPQEALRTLPAWLWWALPILATLVALRGVFNLSEIFYVRDLVGYFWPYHVWFRDAVFRGESLLWDPTIGFGRPLIANPVTHVLFPPAVLLRLLMPEVLGFNLYVALPFPLAALGCFCLLRRRFSPQAASIGAVIFALSGPVLSCGSMPNFSWAIALLPWALWAADRLSEMPSTGRFATLAALFMLQFLAGEPVTLAATAALAVLSAALVDEAPHGWRDRFAASGRVVAAGLTGLLLAAPQALMFFHASSRSYRVLKGGINVQGSSMHPVGLVEALAPGIFGDFMRMGPEAAPFLVTFAAGQSPFLYSIFLGVGAMALAVAGAAAARPRRWVLFWGTVFVISLVFALGFYTPIYPALNEIVPLLKNFRSPSKYLVVTVMAAAALGAAGWHSLADAPRRLAVPIAGMLGLSALAAAAAGAAAVAPETLLAALTDLARAVGSTTNDGEAARLLVAAVEPAAHRLLALSLAAAALLWMCGSQTARKPFVLGLLYMFVAVDLLAANADLNPTLPVANFREPQWVAATRAHPDDRVYVTMKTADSRDGSLDPDTPNFTFTQLSGASYSAINALIISAVAPVPLPWRVREAVSADATLLSSHEYLTFGLVFKSASVEQRTLYLSRVGVRYFFLNHPPAGPSQRIFEPPGLAPLALYEAAPVGGRVSVVPGYAVEPDTRRQSEALFVSQFDPEAVVLLGAEPPPPAGAPGPGLERMAEIAGETPTDVRVVARVPDGGGFLLFKDMYDPLWRAEVDGAMAAVLPADGLFRAVHLAPGEHEVRFRYVPTPLYLGSALSAATALALLASLLVARRRARLPGP